jgi:hypothetical protein
MTNSKFTDKYNFDLREEIELSIKKQSVSKNLLDDPNDKHTEHNENLNHKFRPQDTIEFDNETFNEANFPISDKDSNYQSFKIKVEKIDDELEKKKIIEDNKKYDEILKRKIRLNFKFLTIFLDNFYRDEFNYSRKCSYLIFGAPLTIFGIFYLSSPYSPFVTGSIFISLTGSLIAFTYYFLKEIDKLSKTENSVIGKKIRLIKNEMVLYNPLSKPILDSDMEEENKRI